MTALEAAICLSQLEELTEARVTQRSLFMYNMEKIKRKKRPAARLGSAQLSSAQGKQLMAACEDTTLVVLEKHKTWRAGSRPFRCQEPASDKETFSKPYLPTPFFQFSPGELIFLYLSSFVHFYLFLRSYHNLFLALYSVWSTVAPQ